MPHLRFDYAPDLADLVDMNAFCACLRDAMVETGLFPLGGIRVRGHAADCLAIADGKGPYLFVDMELRIGAGRSAEARAGAVRSIYAAARAHLEPLTGERPFMLSLELRETDPEFSEKSWSTVHAAIARRG